MLANVVTWPVARVRSTRTPVDQLERRPALDQARGETPVVRLAVVAEVAADLAAAAEPRAVHDLDLHVVGELGAQRIEIAGVEARDVGG